MKKMLIIACLIMPLFAAAADSKAPKTAPKPPKAAASAASAPSAASAAAQRVKAREAARASKTRRSDMGACRQQAAEKGLYGVAAKEFIVTCMKSQ